jgi:hypothetical protein
MARRRLVIGVLVLAALSVEVFLSLNLSGLTAEERRLVGVWRTPMSTETPETVVTVFTADGRAYSAELRDLKPTSESVGWWWIRDGRIIMEYEPSAVRRALRPALARMRVKVQGQPRPVGLEWVSDDEIAFVKSDGYRDRWVRIRQD